MIIGVVGKIGVGKDQFGQYLAEELRQRGFAPEIKKFAAKLKAVASLLTGIPVDRFEDRNFKEEALGPEWGSMRIRTFLQKLGTEAIRDGLYQNSWVNALFADYQADSCWIVTDTRFFNEMSAIRSRGGLCVRLLRDTGNTDLHSSETALDGVEMFQIDNNQDLAALRAAARALAVVVAPQGAVGRF